ncbi:hypothetical protein [Psychroflexus sp. MBR-150]|jgi:Mg2+/Co2+ transporter CorB
MQDFFITLLYIVIGFWILRLIFKWAFPYLLKYFVQYLGKKAQKRYENHSQNPFEKQQDYSKHSKTSSKQDKEKVGEYIDFEEID